MTVAKTAGRIAATTLCSSYLTPAVCTPVVNTVFSLI